MNTTLKLPEFLFLTFLFMLGCHIYTMGQTHVKDGGLILKEEIDFSSSHQTACTGLCINFSAISEENVVGWKWIFQGADTKESFEQHPQNICYSQSGLFDVKLVVRKNNGHLDSVIKEKYIEVIDTPVINLGPDLTVCSNISVQLDASFKAKEVAYLWNNGSTIPTINATKDGLYSVTVSIPGCSAFDSIRINHKEAPIVDFGNFAIPCKGDTVSTIKLDVTQPNASYLWDNGSVNGIREIKGEGSYWVALTSNGCETKKKLNITYKALPEVALEDSVSICDGENVILDASVPNGIYLWDNGHTKPTKKGEKGWNLVKVTANGCARLDSTFVREIKKPWVNLGKDTALCNRQISLQVPFNSSEKYLWSNGSTTNKILVNKAGLIWVRVGLEGCFSSDSIHVVDCSDSENIDFSIPNIFTPNADDVNDLFTIANKGIKEITGSIITRWGQLVYSWKGIDDSWDGYTISGEKLPEESYFYFFKIIDRNNQSYLVKGTIDLSR